MADSWLASELDVELRDECSDTDDRVLEASLLSLSLIASADSTSAVRSSLRPFRAGELVGAAAREVGGALDGVLLVDGAPGTPRHEEEELE